MRIKIISAITAFMMIALSFAIYFTSEKPTTPSPMPSVLNSPIANSVVQPTQTSALTCNVYSNSALQAALNNSSCSIIVVYKAAQPYNGFYVRRNGVTVETYDRAIVRWIEVESSRVTIRGFEITDPATKTGFRSYGDDILFEKNDIHHMLEDCMWLWGKRITIKENNCHDILAVDKYPSYDEHVDGVMTYLYSDNFVSEDILIVGNVFDHTRKVGSNQFIIVTQRNSFVPRRWVVKGNVFITSDADPYPSYMPVGALYGGDGFVFDNNIICNRAGTGANPFYIDGATNVTMTNNVVSGYRGSIYKLLNGSVLLSSGNVYEKIDCDALLKGGLTATVTPTRTVTIIPSATRTPTPSLVPIVPTVTPTMKCETSESDSYITTVCEKGQ